jgi:PRTRC genetic system protein A
MMFPAPDSAVLDSYIAGSTPAIPMSHGRHDPLVVPGHRYLVAREGLFVEVARPWVHAILEMATSQVPLPFGSARPLARIKLLCGQIPAHLMASFVEQARRALPNECGAWVIWHAQRREFDLIGLTATSATADNLAYERPVLEAGWSLVMDVHSHGRAPAFFSRTDDQDDKQAGEVKLAGVVGRLDGVPEWRFRLAACGLLKELSP